MADTTEKPLNDKREYRHFVLGDDLDVLLISDPETDKASAACDVAIGQLCDTVPGLAHYLEHMLFIGTRKYPDENAYDQYLSTNGGSSNAFTDLEHTCYYFDVQADCLEGAFDRFAQCFIGPLFTQSAMEREVQAVDSEFAKNNQQDSWRMHQLSKSNIVSSNHPYAAFGSGNKDSLWKDNIRDKLLDFYEQYYRKSLSLYKLVVLGKESLDDLEQMVHRYFDELAASFESQTKESTKPTKAKILQEIYKPVQNWELPKQMNVVPVAQIHAIELQFPMPPTNDMYGYKPTRYLSHLLGHEGKGSLLSCLKTKHFAQELYADDSSANCTNFSIFTIRLELTEVGFANIKEVMAIVFAYIDLLRKSGPQKWVQDELKTVGDLQFKFLSKRNPMDYVCSLAGWMQHYDPEHYLSGAYTLFDWKPNVVEECVNRLNPDNMLMMVSSPTLEGKTSSKCPWFGTSYETLDLDAELWERLKTVQHSEIPELALPEFNDMIATDFGILESNHLPKDRPVCILQHNAVRLWYKPDNVFEMPKVNMIFQFSSPQCSSSTEFGIALNLYSQIVQERCNEFMYLASMAGLYSDLYASQSGLELHVSGYNHKAHILVQRVIDQLVGFAEIEPDIFSRILAKLKQQYESFLVSQPYQHAMNGGDLCLEHIKASVFEKLSTLTKIASTEVLETAKSFFKHCKVAVLVHGNVTAAHTKQITTDVIKKVRGDMTDNAAVIPNTEHRVVQLPSQTTCVYKFAGYNEADTNSCVQILFQMGPLQIDENASLAFLQHLIREPAFNQLRTEEQLGYIVHTSVKTSGYNIKGLLFLIQSDGFDPPHVESRIERFLANFRERIVAMESEEFQNNVDAMVSSFLEKNKNLGEESSRYWNVIQNETFHFTRLQDIAEHVKTMTKQRILMFFDKYVASNAPHRRKLCVQVYAKQHQESLKKSEDANIIEIESPSDFKREMGLYPLPNKVSVDIVDVDAQTS
ncbi:unnamed protein product [Cylindrotheca closterium]|uniref:Insulin-degrading enzyme n=1 Tax=Cylindrotheca closterium TaxID=2856 RepID=A0AAD2JJE8_9STRA|nr:unnamed protein product [Cylindrotheca closterium]